MQTFSAVAKPSNNKDQLPLNTITEEMFHVTDKKKGCKETIPSHF
jgi:hypothetical protein